jgi:casein kinase 1
MATKRNDRRKPLSSSIIKLNKYISEELKIDLVVKKKLGKGAFGVVYKGEYKGQTVAVKVELSKKKDSLSKEFEIYRDLQLTSEDSTTSSSTNLPQCLYYSCQREYRILVIQMMGKNLEHIKDKVSKFSPITTMNIACQMLTLLKYIHSKGIVHKDIKPDNMVTFCDNGCGQGMISLLDFGMSTHYIGRDGKHIKNKDSKTIEGTIRYMSHHTHEGRKSSRRDDFQSLAYSLIYFLKGELPWQGLVVIKNNNNNKKGGGARGEGKEQKELKKENRSENENAKRELIFKLKKEISTSELCKNLPPVFEKFLKYSNSLHFDEKPSYDDWRKLFFQEIKSLTEGNFMDYNLDWM